jgi:GH25 family lysozyme M1 (1,4-beta-N-acetylmuramidase)
MSARWRDICPRGFCLRAGSSRAHPARVIICGVDVSKAQSPTRCDWPRAFDAGVRFAFIRASEGAGGAGAYVDDAAALHLAAVRRTPIFSGVYHVARPDNRFASSPNGRANGVAEGRHACDTALRLGVAGVGSLPIVIDLEKYTPKLLGITDEQRDDFVRGLVDTIEAWTGRLPIIYAGGTYWHYQLSPTLALELRQRGVLLWLVDYQRGIEPLDATIDGWPWSFWQHSGGGDFAFAPPIPGMPNPIDQDQYRGSLIELRGLVG